MELLFIFSVSMPNTISVTISVTKFIWLNKYNCTGPHKVGAKEVFFFLCKYSLQRFVDQIQN